MAVNKSGGWLKWVGVFIVVAAAAWAGVRYFKSSRSAAAPAYQTASVTTGDLTQAVTATGTLNPVVNVTVGSQVSGRICKLYVDYNSMVKSNQVIAEIDPSTYQAAVEQSSADLANARANLELQQVQAARSAQLFTNTLISGSDYDTAIANLHEAEATVKQKQASLNNAQVNLAYCKILSPVDGIVISRAIDLGQTVASSFNTPTLFQIANDLTKMQIDSSVAEADIGGILEGQTVAFTVDAYPYRNFHGTVTQVRNSPTTVNNVVTYDCVISVDNPDYKLKPGMTANVSFIIAQRDNVLKIPNGTLRFRPPDATNAPAGSGAAGNYANSGSRPPGGFGGGGQGGQGGFAGGGRPGGFGGGGRGFHMSSTRTVYMLSGEGQNAKLDPVQIKVGISDGIFTEVTDGLKQGDQVVTGSLMGGSTTAPPGANPFGGGFPRMR
jgi:HlyD family secretion protein